MITVIIPVLNECETVAAVIHFVRRDPNVSEVIVVDDGSIDGTQELARGAGASVITSTLLGKGASMEDGMKAARNEVLLYLDGDLGRLRDDLVKAMTDPILEDRADFVKAKFSRSAGRVTTLTAQPLLRTFFPELARFEQPLGGIVAARRPVLRRMPFEGDYGVDIGLLIDVALSGARVVEVDIGHIEHDSQPLETLGDMAAQVVRTLLDRAAKYGRLNPAHVSEVQEVERHAEAELSILFQKTGRTERLALFDMDGVLLSDRFIVRLAERARKLRELSNFLDKESYSADDRTRHIARLFAGIPKRVFEQTARDIPLIRGARDTVVGLRRAGFRVGIVTDSFRVVSEIVRRRVFADFSIAHLMRFCRGVATGEVTLSPAMVHPAGCARHARCKLNAMLHVIEKMGIGPENVLAVGDSENDVCLLEAAGESVAYCPTSTRVRDAARHVVRGDLAQVLPILLKSRQAAASRWNGDELRPRFRPTFPKPAWS